MAQGAAMDAGGTMGGGSVKPYYQHNGITIYHGDWRSIEPPAADLVLADPPYGVKEKTNRASKGRGMRPDRGWQSKDHAPVAGDDETFDPRPILTIVRKIVLWGANYYPEHLPASPSWLVWDKRDGTTPDDNADCEVAWSNLGGPMRMYRHLWRGVCRASEAGELVLHPTQKPVALMRWCLQRARLAPGALVFDPYMGSGPVAQACKELGFRYVGCELVEQYCDTAARRLSQEVMELV